MQELIDRLKTQVGLTDEQAAQTITVIKDYAKEMMPMFSGAIDQMFDKYSKKDDDFLE
jgi:hypothetical protein